MNTTLSITGMTCDHCVGAVTKALGAVSGVQSANVSLERNEATVSHDPSVRAEDLVKAVAEEGFGASVKAA